MLIKNKDKSSFDMKVMGYQFPDLANEQYDSDWLNIKIDVSIPMGSWTSTDPSLLTWEVADLAKWLESIAEGRSVDAEESFMEPNLRFELIEAGQKKLRIYFELESKPSWAQEDDTLWADFEVDADDLRKAATSLREDLMRFPTRVGL